ncbi:hypothetical protein ACFL2Q_11550 [Thermodesulfobacteriota bacterium]
MRKRSTHLVILIMSALMISCAVTPKRIAYQPLPIPYRPIRKEIKGYTHLPKGKQYKAGGGGAVCLNKPAFLDLELERLEWEEYADSIEKIIGNHNKAIIKKNIANKGFFSRWFSKGIKK